MGHLLQEETVQRKDTETGNEVRRRSLDSGQQAAAMTIVLDLETGQPHGQPISWQQMGFVDGLAVDRRAILGIEITNQQDAADFTDLAVDSACPAVVQLHVGMRVSTEYRWQLVDDGPPPGSAGVRLTRLTFILAGSKVGGNGQTKDGVGHLNGCTAQFQDEQF